MTLKEQCDICDNKRCQCRTCRGIDKIKMARCKCGDQVILPRKELRDEFGGDKNINNPQVWCMDMGHWIGFLSQCK